jgi:radical SAM superfamily enzyme YgiQ (UPF0313 family)
MRVVLISVPIMDYRKDVLVPIAQDETKNCPPYGIYVLAGVLREAGHDVAMLDLVAGGTNIIDSYASVIADASLIGIGATSMSWPTALDVAQQIRVISASVPIVVGGIHPSMFDQYVLYRHPIDFVIRGEGEVALPMLCSAIEGRTSVADIPNLSWRDHAGGFRSNPAGPKLNPQQLGDSALPAYDLMPKGIYKGLSIESSRGCAFDCSFCSTSYRRSYRGMDPVKFVDRLEAISSYIDDTVYGTVHVIDDEFSLNPKRAISIIKEMRNRGRTFGLVYDSRANDLLYPGYVEEIADYTHQFLVGAECGYDEGLAKIGKGTTCAKLEAAAAMLLRYGISGRADFSFILGLPWETETEIKATIRFATQLYANYGVRILLQWYCQIPGSRLWDSARKSGKVTEAMYDDYGFFRNLYLWSTTNSLHPTELWKIVDMIQQLQWISNLEGAQSRMIESAVPHVLLEYFPKAIMSESVDDRALRNLRELSSSRAEPRVPQRTVYQSA